MYKCARDGSSDGRPDAELEGALDVRLNVEFEWAP